MSFYSGFVSIIGRPNVGKSTLINRIIGEKVAIVSDKPQTTRNRIQAIRNYENAQVIFLDTPGIHKPLYRMNQYMLKSAMSSLAGMDVILVMMDATAPPGKGDQYILDNLPKGEEKIFLLLNKVDLMKKDKILSRIIEYNEKYNFAEVFPISALTGDKVRELEDTIIDYLPEGPKYFEDDRVTEYSEHFLASEIIREKILWITHDELPYTTAVQIELWEEAKNHERIHAVIYVEKESQKGIVIGKKGERLKQIGTEARLELEKIFGVKIYLNLWIKVKYKWRDNEVFLREFGYKDD